LSRTSVSPRELEGLGVFDYELLTKLDRLADLLPANAFNFFDFPRAVQPLLDRGLAVVAVIIFVVFACTHFG
jgi:hypothetical protein